MQINAGGCAAGAPVHTVASNAASGAPRACMSLVGRGRCVSGAARPPALAYCRASGAGTGTAACMQPCREPGSQHGCRSLHGHAGRRLHCTHATAATHQARTSSLPRLSSPTSSPARSANTSAWPGSPSPSVSPLCTSLASSSLHRLIYANAAASYCGHGPGAGWRKAEEGEDQQQAASRGLQHNTHLQEQAAPPQPATNRPQQGRGSRRAAGGPALTPQSAHQPCRRIIAS